VRISKKKEKGKGRGEKKTNQNGPGKLGERLNGGGVSKANPFNTSRFVGGVQRERHNRDTRGHAKGVQKWVIDEGGTYYKRSLLTRPHEGVETRDKMAQYASIENECP